MQNAPRTNWPEGRSLQGDPITFDVYSFFRVEAGIFINNAIAQDDFFGSVVVVIADQQELFHF